MEQVTQGKKRMSKVTVVEFFENKIYDMIEVIQDTEDMAGQELPGCVYVCLFSSLSIVCKNSCNSVPRLVSTMQGN